MTTIDPVEFGELRGKVEALEGKVDKIQKDVEELLALANRSKGALWVLMGIAAMVGAAMHWTIDKVLK